MTFVQKHMGVVYMHSNQSRNTADTSKSVYNVSLTTTFILYNISKSYLLCRHGGWSFIFCSFLLWWLLPHHDIIILILFSQGSEDEKTQKFISFVTESGKTTETSGCAFSYVCSLRTNCAETESGA